MNIVSFSIIALIGVITCVIIRGYKPEFGFLIILVLSMVLLMWVLEVFAKMEEAFSDISLWLDENQEFYKILFKVMGITYICEFTSGICKDAGITSVATQIEILGKMLILLSGIPILISVVDMIKNYKI